MTTTASYEERIQQFAQGKRLRRFRGMIRNPRNSLCDACGSSQPSYLYGLRDMETRRDYFVGMNCMARLAQLAILERPFVRVDIVTAYNQARGIPEKIALPHQPNFAEPHPCCIHFPRNGDGPAGT